MVRFYTHIGLLTHWSSQDEYTNKYSHALKTQTTISALVSSRISTYKAKKQSICVFVYIHGQTTLVSLDYTRLQPIKMTQLASLRASKLAEIGKNWPELTEDSRRALKQ